MEPPETQFVAVGDADVAYQVLGDGPRDLLFLIGLGSHIEVAWEDPLSADFLTHLASVSRLIFLDRRGTGASDGVPRSAIPTWEEWTEDIGAVLDAVGSERTVIMANLDGGPISVLYAVGHPERVDALVLYNTAACYALDEDYPIGVASEAIDAIVEIIRATWGTLEFVSLANPSLPIGSPRLNLLARLFRSSATPRTAAVQYDYVLRNLDVRSVLPLVQVPTLVLSTDNRSLLPIEHGQYLASHIEGAKFAALPGGDMHHGQHAKALFEEVAEFLTGARPMADIDRVLASVLFTDIVGSTELAASMGDHRWRDLLRSHDTAAERIVEEYRGRLVKTTGDGILATFDGPGRAISCARVLRDAIGGLGLTIRAGLHTGEIELGEDDIAGIAVHIGARIAASAGPSEVLVSSTVKDLVAGSGIQFDDRGEHELKGVPGPWRLFAVRG